MVAMNLSPQRWLRVRHEFDHCLVFHTSVFEYPSSLAAAHVAFGTPGNISGSLRGHSAGSSAAPRALGDDLPRAYSVDMLPCALDSGLTSYSRWLLCPVRGRYTMPRPICGWIAWPRLICSGVASLRPICSRDRRLQSPNRMFSIGGLSPLKYYSGRLPMQEMRWVYVNGAPVAALHFYRFD